MIGTWMAKEPEECPSDIERILDGPFFPSDWSSPVIEISRILDGPS